MLECPAQPVLQSGDKHSLMRWRVHMDRIYRVCATRQQNLAAHYRQSCR